MKGTCHHVHGSPLPSSIEKTRSLVVLSSTQRRRLLIAAKATRSSKPVASKSACVSTTTTTTMFRRFSADQRKVEGDPEGSSGCSLRLPPRPIPSEGHYCTGDDDTSYGRMALADGRYYYDSDDGDAAYVGQERLLEYYQGLQRSRWMQRGGRRPACCCSSMMQLQDAKRPVSAIALMTVRERVEHDARQRRLERHAAKRWQEDQTFGHTTPPARRRKRKAKDLRRQVLLKNAQKQQQQSR